MLDNCPRIGNSSALIGCVTREVAALGLEQTPVIDFQELQDFEIVMEIIFKGIGRITTCEFLSLK